MLKRWKLTIEYNGTDYYGWQKQEPAFPTIQDEIQKAIYKFCQTDVVLHVAGRTDAGVHAYGQIAHFDLNYGDRPLTGLELSKAINAHLAPRPIVILNAEETTDAFHARHIAKNKLYEYRVINRPARLSLDHGLAWHIRRPLDVAAMHEAAQVLLGHHDFTSFRDAQCQAASPIKTLDRVDVTTSDYDSFGGKDIRFQVEAKSFLHHQVRNIVGSLTMVGEGKWTAKDLRTVLEAKDRTKAGITAPAAGLFMIRVDYADV